MGRELELSDVDPTYLEFFGLTQPPFARPTEPSQLFHTEQYSVMMEKLFNATTKNDSLVIVCGANGSGKSTQLKRFINSVDDSIYCVVIDETCHGEEQFYHAFLTQIGFSDITGTAHELKNITKEFIVCRGIAGDHILITIDNAHLTDPTILDQLRQLCEIKIKDRRVLSVVLAGTADIIRVVDAPAMRQTRFQNHVVFSIRNYSEAETESYVWHRLNSAGGNNAIKISGDAGTLIHRYSGGNPDVINSLCNEILAQAFKLNSRVITEEIVRSAADKQQLLPHVISFHGKGRRKSDPEFKRMRSVPKKASAETRNWQQHAAKLSAQIDDLRADKKRALQDIDAKNGDIEALRGKLVAQAAEVDRLTLLLGRSAEKSTELDRALNERSASLQESESKSTELAASLQEEIRRREVAENALADATTAAERARQAEDKLQALVDSQAHTDLISAEERAADLDANIKLTESLQRETDKQANELKSLRDELASRNELVAEIEEQLDQVRLEYEQAQSRIVGLKSPEELEEIQKASRKLAAEHAKEARERRAADKNLAEATATIEQLKQDNQDLQSNIDELKDDLESSVRIAEGRASEIEALEKIVADLNDDAEAKAGEVSSLQDELESNNAKLANVEKHLGETHAQLESAQLSIAAMKTPEELEDVKKALTDLAAEMANESAAREAAEKELATATARVDELALQNEDLVATVRGLDADLAVAGERVLDVYVLERKVSDVTDEVNQVTRELDLRNQAFADLEKQLDTLQDENERLRLDTPSVDEEDDSSPDESASKSRGEDHPYRSRVVEMFEHSIRDVSAYQTLRKFDPEFYDGLVATYKTLTGQGLTDKQVNDALRSKQVELMERLLPKASDNAIIAYARLMVAQLDELQLDGIEPCLTFLVPKPDPDDVILPVFSESTRIRELDALDKTLKSFKAKRKLPSQEDVWSDLGPVFSDLIKAFGAENVAALENSYDPNIDRVLACNVSRALYSGILNFPKRSAANALRWLLAG